jgi:hypothetical protein
MEHKIETPVDKWISRIWSIMFALTIGVAMFVIAYTTAA